MIQFPLEGSCYSSRPLFPCCSWKRICTIRVSWDCVLVIVIKVVTLRAQYSRVVCELFQWVWDDIWTYFTSIQIFQKYLFFAILRYSYMLQILSPHYVKKTITFIIIIPAFFAVWHYKLIYCTSIVILLNTFVLKFPQTNYLLLTNTHTVQSGRNGEIDGGPLIIFAVGLPGLIRPC